jgi:hypothetical protein
MQLDDYVTEVQIQLTATAALGDETTRRIAGALAAAAEPAVRLALLNAVSAAADEITAALLDSSDAPGVSVRLDGDDLRIELRRSQPAEGGVDAAGGSPDDADNTARISLRLPETLKSDVEAAARRDGISVNTWIVRAVGAVLSGSRRGGRRTSPWETGTPHRLSGWIKS